MNSYRDFVAATARLFKQSKSLAPKASAPAQKKLPANAPVAIIFSPHPDDECIVGALPLRLLRETSTRVVNVAVTLGSDKKRRAARLQEVKNACDTLGFELEQTTPGGLAGINPEARKQDPQAWAMAVKVIAAIFTEYQPQIVFFPHNDDHHTTHTGTHFLVMDALKLLPKKIGCLLVETEFWGHMRTPNLLVESSVDDVSALVNALALHTGEVRRNPYHLRLPAWMKDNVRRGAELIGGKGGKSPDFLFGTLYRIRQWKNGRIHDHPAGGKFIGSHDSVPKSIAS